MAKHFKSSGRGAQRASKCQRQDQRPEPSSRDDKEWDDADDDSDALDPHPEADEIWEPLDLADDEEAEPAYGDFWHEPLEDED